ncbi:RNA ligase 1-like [Liolophura sinensis]|uniref:RNA ligase 1-like n=1 Tax=Liolophura sinensis TaxID=3198878 RepID=UPI0031596AC8
MFVFSEMMELGSVQNKLACVFEVEVLREPSDKRCHQSYRVVATDRLRTEAIEHNVVSAVPSEKLDGTCVLISDFQGKPWLWARHDRKPSKQAERKFRAFQSNRKHLSNEGEEAGEEFVWNVSKDFREVPEHWVAAAGVESVAGVPQPESNGHIPGWVPVEPSSRQHCWHLSAVNLHHGLALVLREDEHGDLEIVAVPLAELDGHTAELIGTNINANAYKIGTKQCPLHLLIVHGSVKLQNPPRLALEELKDWFSSSPAGKVEGIVWHCEDKTLFKLHRHHLGLPWPVQEPIFSQRRVKLCVDMAQYHITQPVNSKHSGKDLFFMLGKARDRQCDSLSKVHELLTAT